MTNQIRNPFVTRVFIKTETNEAIIKDNNFKQDIRTLKQKWETKYLKLNIGHNKKVIRINEKHIEQSIRLQNKFNKEVAKCKKKYQTL